MSLVHDVHRQTNASQLYFFEPTLFFSDGVEHRDGGENLFADQEVELKLDNYIHGLEGIKEGEIIEF